MARPTKSRTAHRITNSLTDPDTRALMCAIAHVGPIVDSMRDVTREQWEDLRKDVWRGWVWDMQSYCSPGYSPLPRAAILYDKIDDPANIETAPMPDEARALVRQRQAEIDAMPHVRYNVETRSIEHIDP